MKVNKDDDSLLYAHRVTSSLISVVSFVYTKRMHICLCLKTE